MAHADAAPTDVDDPIDHSAEDETLIAAAPADVEQDDAVTATDDGDDNDGDEPREDEEDGPVHRPLIRASLPRPEGQQPPARPIPEFTIRQPGGRPNRFRPRGAGFQRSGGGGGPQFQGNRSNGNTAGGPPRGMRSNGGRPPHGAQGAAPSRLARRNGPGRKRSK